ncbi:MAG: GNAT family protein [Melioribacteraceae bacterium]|jgi:RimJ/RimL family protein N-acetyltransferase|nr:MAG: GNAT family protein [Melioribacteraceae bacterium]
MLVGELVCLGPVETFHLKKILEWRNNEFFRKHFREHKEISYSQQLKWFQQIDNKNNLNEYMFAIYLTKSNEFIGVCGINHIDWINRNCQLSLFIGKNLLYIDNNGWANESVKLLEKYTFFSLNLIKIYVEVYEFDSQRYGLLESLGYEKEARLQKQIYKDGKFYDSFIYSKFKKDTNDN